MCALHSLPLRAPAHPSAAASSLQAVLAFRLQPAAAAAHVAALAKLSAVQAGGSTQVGGKQWVAAILHAAQEAITAYIERHSVGQVLLSCCLSPPCCCCSCCSN